MKVVIIVKATQDGRTAEMSRFTSDEPWAKKFQFEFDSVTEATTTIQQLRDRITSDKDTSKHESVRRNIWFGAIAPAGVQPNEQEALVAESDTLLGLLFRDDVQEVIAAELLPPDTLVLKLFQNKLKPILQQMDVLDYLNNERAANVEKLGFDPVNQGVPTAGAKCRNNCGFHGRHAGFCSTCWKQQTSEDRIRWSLVMKDQVEEYRKEQQAVEQANRAKRKREEEQELARQQAKLQRQQENEKRKQEGRCHYLRPLTGGDLAEEDVYEEPGTPWNLYRDHTNEEQHQYEIWTCGVWHAGDHEHHHHATAADSDDWKQMYENLIQPLDSLVQSAVECTEGNNPFQATWLHADFLASRGVDADAPAPEALRAALQWDTPFDYCIKLQDHVPCFFRPEYSFDNNDVCIPEIKAKLVEATRLMRAHCSQAYLFAFDGSKCEPTYPVGMVARTKSGGHLVFVFAERVET